MAGEKEVKLSTLNPCIVCKICKGYLISATTVTECLHTFCKSCLVKHLEENNTCPECNIVIHQSHPLQYIQFDRTMQDLVYKLVPGLMEDELERERNFYKARGTLCPKDISGNGQLVATTSSSSDQSHEASNYHRHDEQINIQLEPGLGMKPLPKKFVRVSAKATVSHVRKYVCLKLGGLQAYEIEILCNGEPQAKDHSLKFVYVTKWRFKDTPLVLMYQRTG